MKRCNEVTGSRADAYGTVELVRCVVKEPCWKHHGGVAPWWHRLRRLLLSHSVSAGALALLCLALPAYGQRHRPSRSTVPEPSVFESFRLDMWRTNYPSACPLDPVCPERLDLPYAACRVVAKAITPGQGRGAEGGSWMLTAVDPHCVVDPSPFFVPLDIPIAEFRGDNAAGPWLGAGEVLACRSAVNCAALRCDAFVVSVFVEGDGPDKPERLWGIRQILKCWSAVDMDDSFAPERRRVSGR